MALLLAYLAGGEVLSVFSR